MAFNHIPPGPLGQKEQYEHGSASPLEGPEYVKIGEQRFFRLAFFYRAMKRTITKQ
jgi:hypothetical protein